MRRCSPARWWREQVSEVEAQRAHWKPEGHGALGESTHSLIAGVCISQETYWLQREVGKSFLPPYLLWLSLFKTLSWPSWELQSECERNITSRRGHWQVQVTASLPSPCGSSLLPSMCFWLWASLQALPPSEALVPHPWLDHDSGSSLVATSSPTAPTGVGLGLWSSSSSSSTQVSKDQICAKERSSL